MKVRSLAVEYVVIPANAGIQNVASSLLARCQAHHLLDPGVCRDDGKKNLSDEAFR
jgi:hypothetical protein